jgi:ABC-type multidrug transport system fused ATPase/permease subunit
VRRGLAILGQAIKAEPKPFSVSLLGAGAYGTATVGSALVFGTITDRVILPAFARGEATYGALVAAAAAVLAVAIAKSAGIIARRVGASLMQLRLTAVYRERITQQYNRLPLRWHHEHSTGSLLSNANADVEATFWPIAPLPFACGVILMLVVAVGALLATDVFLSAVAVVVGPLLALLNSRYNRRISGPATRAQEHRADVSAVAHESFDGALVVKTLGRERAETDRFEVESERLRDELVAYGRVRAMFDPLMEALPNVGVLLVLLVGAWRLQQGSVTEGDLVQFAYLFTLLAFPIRAIGWVLSEMPRSVVGWDRVQAVLTAPGAVRYGNLDGAAPDRPADADMSAVSFAYGADPVLREVTFRAGEGHTIAVVGPTGSGKSTIASLLVRLADPDQGTVQLDGRDLRDLARGTVARSAAVVLQHSFLFDDTVRENITLGAPFTDEEVRAAARLAQADGFVEALPQGYDTVVGEQGTSLSGGQRQRLSLARALIRRPRLLILDDATSHVDTAVEAAILRGLREADLPSTIVIVAYRLATITLADEIVFVEHGRVRATGTHAELMATVPAYARLITAYADESARREAEL